MQLHFKIILLNNEKIFLVKVMQIDKLKQLRQDKNYTQEQIAKILNVKRGTYASWECGNDIIPTKQLYKLAEFYHISIDYILNINNSYNKIKVNKDINLTEIGNNLKQIRIKENLSQAKIAKSININQSTWWAYEKGKTLVTTSTLIEINKVYNHSIDWILGRKNLAE